MYTSNQDLWKILTGHSSLRDPKLIESEVCSCVERLRKGLAYYRPRTSPPADSKPKAPGQVKDTHKQFVLLLCSQLNLDQEQSLDLFESFVSGVFRGSPSQLNSQLAMQKQRQDLLEEVRGHYYTERLTLLHCVKHLLGYWQDVSHPYREVYRKCLEKIDESELIKGLWKQYKSCAEAEMPTILQSRREESVWVVQNLREQSELLEIIVLYYKDFSHPPSTLLESAKLFEKLGFGFRQRNRVSLVPTAEPLITHLNHLSSLILVEAIDLDYVYNFHSDPVKLQRHHLIARGDDKPGDIIKQLDTMIEGWGDMVCHAPFLLAWMVFTYITRQDSADLEHSQLLGNKALQSGVFDYLLSILQSPYQARDTPVSGVCKGVIHALLSVCVSSFSEQSLGDLGTLIAIATKSLTQPRLKLEFWEKGLNHGVGLLLSSAISKFPACLSPSLPLLTTLSAHPLTASSVTRYLRCLSTLTEEANGEIVEMEGQLVLSQPRSLYEQEARHLGVPPLVIQPGTVGNLLPITDEGQRSQLIAWKITYSALDVFSFETCRVLYCPGIGIDSTAHPEVARVSEITKLVTEILANDWASFEHFCPITMQYYALIQKLSPLPNPPAQLLAACLQCLATMMGNNCSEVWDKLTRTGFLPYINGPYSSLDRVPVSSGHFGHVLNTCERTRGVYVVTMATTDLLLRAFESVVAIETSDLLAGVVYIMREVFSSCHNWRYRSPTGRDELIHKLLNLCHSILKRERHYSESRMVVCEFVSHFLLHSHGHQTLLGTLSLGVGVANTLLSSPRPHVQVESLKQVFGIIDLLLQAKSQKDPTALEHALATQSIKQIVDTPTKGRGSKLVHLVFLIASCIHHHDDPHVPVGATKLLTRLSLVAPMSVFACLGQEVTPIRDAYISRLRSHVEDTQLKVVILELILASVHSQPGMAELFLSVGPSKSLGKGEPRYSLQEESCLHAVLDIIKPKTHPPPNSLGLAAVSLLHGLWEGRHDAALIALRGQKDFWRNITNSLVDQGSKEKDCDRLVASHVMSIVAMETYNVVKQQMDCDLADILKTLASKDRYCFWIRCLGFSSERLLEAQLELSRALSSLLLVVSTSPDAEVSLSDPSLRIRILKELLTSLESQLASPTNTIAIATELSMLYLVLFRKWSCDLDQSGCNRTLARVSQIIQLSGSLSSNTCNVLHTHILSIVALLYQSARKNNSGLEARFSLGLVPFVAEIMQNHHGYIMLGSKFRPDITAVYVLNEIVGTLSPDLWLPSLRHHSLLTVIVRAVDEHVKQQSDRELVEAILTLCLTLAQTKQGAESLLLNGLNHTLCISLTEVVSTLPLQPDSYGKQVSGSPWREVWLTVLRVIAGMLRSLGHQFLTHCLDFVGVHQERLAAALDVFHAIKDLPSLEETVCVCRLILTLSQYKAQWQFSLPSLCSSLLDLLVLLTSSLTALLSKRAAIKHVIKTMNAAGVLPPEVGPTAIAMSTSKLRRRMRTVSVEKSHLDDSLITSCPAFFQLQDGLVTALTLALSALRHFSPDLDAMILDGVLDLVEYPPLFALSLTPPTVDNTTPPSLGTLTTGLSTALALLNKVDPGKLGSPSKSPSVGISPSHPRTQTSAEKRCELVCLLEQTVFLLLSQATRYLVDPAVDTHEKQLLKKELASELGTFLNSLLLNFSRKGVPSPSSSLKSATPSRSHTHFQTLADGGSSGKVSSFSEEQGLFRLAETFVEQFFR